MASFDEDLTGRWPRTAVADALRKATYSRARIAKKIAFDLNSKYGRVPMGLFQGKLLGDPAVLQTCFTECFGLFAPVTYEEWIHCISEAVLKHGVTASDETIVESVCGPVPESTGKVRFPLSTQRFQLVGDDVEFESIPALCGPAMDWAWRDRRSQTRIELCLADEDEPTLTVTGYASQEAMEQSTAGLEAIVVLCQHLLGTSTLEPEHDAFDMETYDIDSDAWNDPQSRSVVESVLDLTTTPHHDLKEIDVQLATALSLAKAMTFQGDPRVRILLCCAAIEALVCRKPDNYRDDADKQQNESTTSAFKRRTSILLSHKTDVRRRIERKVLDWLYDLRSDVAHGNQKSQTRPDFVWRYGATIARIALWSTLREVLLWRDYPREPVIPCKTKDELCEALDAAASNGTPLSKRIDDDDGLAEKLVKLYERAKESEKRLRRR